MPDSFLPVVARPDGNRFRQRRFALVKCEIERLASLWNRPVRIIDVGGTEEYWLGMGDMLEKLCFSVDLVNIDKVKTTDPRFVSHAGNACNLSAFDDQSFDLAFSNSVIEHVGHWSEMRQMANEVRRLAPWYIVQTPNFWFPYEPHFRTPFYHWLPEQVRAKMLLRRRLGFRGPAKDIDAAMQSIQSANLLNEAQMRSLFPDAQLIKEKVLGLTKSLTAARLSHQPQH